MNNKIIIVTHKKVDIHMSNLYHLVGVGKDNTNTDWVDSSGTNISDKNKYYCELTALYWFWKNKAMKYDVVGLCHYRRFFSRNFWSLLKNKKIENYDINCMLNEGTVILPRPFKWKNSVGEMYYKFGDGKKADLDLMIEIIKEKYPSYYESILKILKSHSASYCNMFIMTYTDLNNYCRWLFDILFTLEKRTDLTGYSVQEQRIYGYLSEILLNVWVEKNEMKIKYLPMLKTEESFARKIKDEIKFILHLNNG